VTFWAHLRFHLLLQGLRAAWRVLRWAITAAVLAAAAPVTIVAAIAYTGAWLRGWPPAKLWRAAAWALPMTGVYLAGRALQARAWRALALAPVHDWEHAWHLAQAGHVVTAFVLCAPVGVPAALAAAGTAWAWRIYAVETGLSGKTATAPVIFDRRQWARQARTARARITAPGTVPLTDGHGRQRPARPARTGDCPMSRRPVVHRAAERLIRRACRRLPGDTRDERYREWAAEVPAIVHDPDIRFALLRSARALRFAAGTIISARRTPGSITYQPEAAAVASARGAPADQRGHLDRRGRGPAGVPSARFLDPRDGRAGVLNSGFALIQEVKLVLWFCRRGTPDRTRSSGCGVITVCLSRRAHAWFPRNGRLPSAV
jgi:hypothetical protein